MGNMLDTLFKLSAPAAVIIAAVIANNFQSDMAARSTLNQREQSESALRAQMFGNLIDPIFGMKKIEDIPVEEESLLVELLALNFHEHIELKPLMLHADQRLRQEIKRIEEDKKDTKSTDKKNVLEERHASLLSNAKRVKDRQVAMLQGEMTEPKDCKEGCQEKAEQTFYLERKDLKESESFDVRPPDHNGEGCPEQAYNRDGKVFKIMSPDCRDVLQVSFVKVVWEERTVRLHAVVRDEGNEFTISPYDFPFTDNTLLPSGNRFAIYYVDWSSKNTSMPETIRIRFLWFPKNYFPPRERPMDYKAFRKLSGLGLPGV